METKTVILIIAVLILLVIVVVQYASKWKLKNKYAGVREERNDYLQARNDNKLEVNRLLKQIEKTPNNPVLQKEPKRLLKFESIGVDLLNGDLRFMTDSEDRDTERVSNGTVHVKVIKGKLAGAWITKRLSNVPTQIKINIQSKR